MKVINNFECECPEQVCKFIREHQKEGFYQDLLTNRSSVSAKEFDTDCGLVGAESYVYNLVFHLCALSCNCTKIKFSKLHRTQPTDGLGNVEYLFGSVFDEDQNKLFSAMAGMCRTLTVTTEVDDDIYQLYEQMREIVTSHCETFQSDFLLYDTALLIKHGCNHPFLWSVRRAGTNMMVMDVDGVVDLTFRRCQELNQFYDYHAIKDNETNSYWSSVVKYLSTDDDKYFIYDVSLKRLVSISKEESLRLANNYQMKLRKSLDEYIELNQNIWQKINVQ